MYITCVLHFYYMYITCILHVYGIQTMTKIDIKFLIFAWSRFTILPLIHDYCNFPFMILPRIYDSLQFLALNLIVNLTFS